MWTTAFNLSEICDGINYITDKGNFYVIEADKHHSAGLLYTMTAPFVITRNPQVGDKIIYTIGYEIEYEYKESLLIDFTGVIRSYSYTLEKPFKRTYLKIKEHAGRNCLLGEDDYPTEYDCILPLLLEDLIKGRWDGFYPCTVEECTKEETIPEYYAYYDNVKDDVLITTVKRKIEPPKDDSEGEWSGEI